MPVPAVPSMSALGQRTFERRKTSSALCQKQTQSRIRQSNPAPAPLRLLPTTPRWRGQCEVELVRFGGVNGHVLVKRLCKPNCKPTGRHGLVSGITR